MISEHHPAASPQRNRTPGHRRSAIGLAGGLLAGTAAGLVLGVPGLSSAASSGVAVPAAAVQQVDESDADAPAMGERLRENLQALVDDGTLTAEQADAVTAQLVENRPERGERRERGMRGGPGAFGRGVGSEAVTDLLGIEAGELREQLRDGATLAEIADAAGVDPQAVIDELVGELEERVAAAVESGRIDQSDADPRLVGAEARITELVTNGRD